MSESHEKRGGEDNVDELVEPLLLVHVNWLYGEYLGATTTDLSFTFDQDGFERDLLTTAIYITENIKKMTNKDIKMSKVHELLIEKLTERLEDSIAEFGRYIDRSIKNPDQRQHNINVGREALKKVPHPGQDTLFE